MTGIDCHPEHAFCVVLAGSAPSPSRPQPGSLSDFGAPGTVLPPGPGSEAASGSSGGGGGGWFSWMGAGGKKEEEERKPAATELSDPYGAPAPPQFR